MVLRLWEFYWLGSDIAGSLSGLCGVVWRNIRYIICYWKAEVGLWFVLCIGSVIGSRISDEKINIRVRGGVDCNGR